MDKKYLQSVEKRFTKYTVKGPGCWEWTAFKDGKGYGKLQLMDGKRRTGTSWAAHRVSALLYLGFDPDLGLQVNHACGSNGCVNPNHLYVGTHKDNMQDAIVLGEVARGERHGMAKCTDAQVAWAREQYAGGVMNQREIGERLGVSQPCVGYWVRGEYRV